MLRKYTKRKKSVISCCVPGCLENSTRNRISTLHPLPNGNSTQGRRFLRFLNSVGATFKSLPDGAKVCEDHFRLYAQNPDRKQNAFCNRLRNPIPSNHGLGDREISQNSEDFGQIDLVVTVPEMSQNVELANRIMPVETAKNILKEYDYMRAKISHHKLKEKAFHLIQVQSCSETGNFDDLDCKGWLHNEIELSSLGTQNEEAMTSFLTLSQSLAENQREVQLFLDQSLEVSANIPNQDISLAQNFLEELTQARQKCSEEVRECIQLSDELSFRTKHRWNFLRKLSDAQEVLQYLFDELVNRHVRTYHQDAAPSLIRTIKEEPDNDTVNWSTRKRRRTRDGTSFALSLESESDPLDLSDLLSNDVSVYETHDVIAIKPDLAAETESNERYVSDFSQLLSPNDSDAEHAPSASQQNVAEDGPDEPASQEAMKMTKVAETSSCVRITLVGSKIVNMDTNAVLVDLNCIASETGKSLGTSCGKLDPHTLQSLVKLLPGAKKSLRVVTVPAISGPAIVRSPPDEPNTVRSPPDEPDLTDGPATESNKAPNHFIKDSPVKCLSKSPPVVCKNLRAINDLNRQPFTDSSAQISEQREQEPNRQPQPKQVEAQHQEEQRQPELNIPTRSEGNVPRAAPSPPCVRLTLIDNKIVNLENNTVMVDLNSMGASVNAGSPGTLDPKTLMNLIKVLPGVKKSLRVVSVPVRSRVDSPSSSSVPSDLSRPNPKI